MNRPESAVKLLGPDGEDRGDWIWPLFSKSRPHAYGAYDEVLIYLNEQLVKVTISRRRKRVHVAVNHVIWAPDVTTLD